MATNSVEVQLAPLEGAFEQITERLARLEVRMVEMAAGLREEIGRTRAELLARMDRQFFWVLGLLVISILVPIALRFLPAP